MKYYMGKKRKQFVHDLGLETESLAEEPFMESTDSREADDGKKDE